MPAFICTTCGTQHAPSDEPPAGCATCQDVRQYVNLLGQSWTTMEAIRRTHMNAWRRYERRLLGIGTTPAFAIGQRALLLRLGGHFAGATVLHWAAGAEGAGALLSGDIVQVGPDRQVSFMRSYPNLFPLDAGSVRHIEEVLAPYPVERIYGAWWDRIVPSRGKEVLENSVRRYLAAINTPPDAVTA